MSYIKERKNLFMAALCALCVVMMITSAVFDGGAHVLRRPINFLFMPVVSAFSNVGGFIAARTHAVLNIAALELETSRLREENEQLLRQLGLMESYLGYMQEWQELMGVREPMFASLPLLPANIFTRGQGIWHGRPHINAGEMDGVMVNMPVVRCSVFGRVVSVGRNYSEVLPITDDTSVFAVYSRTTNCEGMARGCYTLMLDGLLRLTFTHQNAEFAVGDTIYTSYLSSFFPPGLRVGEIIEMRTTDAGERYAIVRPFADVHRGRAVFVIMGLFEFEME